MATIARCGFGGEVSLGGEITNWEFTLNMDVPDATSMSSMGWHEHLGCLQWGDGSFETLVPCGNIGAHNSVTLSNDLEDIDCDIIITGIDTTDNVADIVKYKYTFISTGEVVIS